jgi:hypothetical protein
LGVTDREGTKMSDKNCSEQEKTGQVERRALLRTGGAAVAAGVAGLTAVEMVTASSAQAASGDPLLMGRTDNTAGTDPTSLTSAATTSPTFTLANTAAGVAPLRLAEKATPDNADALDSGDLVNFDGHLYYTDRDFGVGFVYTEYTSSQLVPITPQRILDTRTVAGRSHITNPSGNLDSAGRLRAGKTIVISMGGLVVAAVAAYCNLTAVTPSTAGYLTLWAGGTRPPTSSINYAAGAVIANFAVTGTSATDTVSIFSYATSHVLLDVAAFAVGNAGQVTAAVSAIAGPNQTSQRLAARARAGTLPSWYKPL